MKRFLAFDIGATNTRLALVNENFEIEKEIIKPTPFNDATKFMQNCVEMVKLFPLENVVAIGAGVPGVVDREKVVILDLPNVKVKNINFGEILTKEFNLPVYLRNDAEVACLGEAYIGAGKEYDRVFFITISSGLGGALCVDKKCQDYVTEVGHTLFNYKNTFQEYSIITGKRIGEFTKLNGSDITDPKKVFEEVKNNTKLGKIFLKEWISILDNFVKLMINSYSPDVICFTGGIFNEKELFFEKLKKMNKSTKIVECDFGTQAGIIGAAVYAMQCAKII